VEQCFECGRRGRFRFDIRELMTVEEIRGMQERRCDEPAYSEVIASQGSLGGPLSRPRRAACP
jgi:hypothetical protein